MNKNKRIIDLDNLPENIEFSETKLTDDDKKKITELYIQSAVIKYLQEPKCLIKGILINKVRYFSTNYVGDAVTTTKSSAFITIENLPQIEVLYVNFEDIKIGQNVIFEFLKYSEIPIACYPSPEKIHFHEDETISLTKSIKQIDLENYTDFLFKSYKTNFFATVIIIQSVLYSISIYFFLIKGLLHLRTFDSRTIFFIILAYIIVHGILYYNANSDLWNKIRKLKQNRCVHVHRFTLSDKYLSKGNYDGGVLIGNGTYYCNYDKYKEINPGDYIEVIQLQDNVTTLEIKLIRKKKIKNE